MFGIQSAGVDLHFCSHFSAVFGHLRRGQVRQVEVDEIASNFAKGGALPRAAAARTAAAAASRARVSKELFAIERIGSRANYVHAAGLRVKKYEKYKQICVTMWEINCFVHHIQEPPPQPPDDQVPVLRHLLLLLPADDLLRWRPHLLPHRLTPMDAGRVHGRRAKQKLQVC